MTAFILAAAALLALGCAFIAWPLLRRADAADGADRGRTNVDLYRQRVQEIDYDRDIGTISAAQAAALTTELAGTLLDDAVVAAPATEVGGRSVRVALALAVTLVITAVGLYRYLGAYDEVALAEAAQVLRSDAVAPVAVADLVKRLRTHLAAQPSDAESWYLLGHALLRNDDAPGAVTAFEALVALVPDEAGAAVALAQARYIADDGVITPANRTLIDTIIASDPTQTIVNEMLALSAFQAADYAAAVRHLEQALAGGASGARAQSLQTGLARARAALGDTGPAMAVTVDLGAAAAGLPETAVLFVFARKPGERMPLLVARRGVQDSPITVRLDAANAMQGTVHLSGGDVLEVGARLSRSGNLVADTNDPQATVGDVRLTGGVVDVQLALATGGSVAHALVGPAATSQIVAAPHAPAIPITVQFAPGIAAAAPARVYIIARAPDGPPMPIAVRALDPGALPVTLTLTDADAMQAGRALSSLNEVEVVARLSRSGSPMRGAGDVESAARRIDPRSNAPVALIIGAQ